MKRVYSEEGISPTIATFQGGNTQPKIIASTQANAAVNENGISPTLTTAMGLGGGQVPMIEEPKLTLVGELEDSKGGGQGYRVYDSNGIATTQSSSSGGIGGKTGLYLTGAYGRDYGSKGKLQKDDVCDTLQAAMGEGGGNVPIVQEINKNAKHQQDLVQSEDDICRTIPAGTHGSTPHLLKTVVSDKRLQKLVDNTEFEEGKVLNLDTYNQTTNENISQCLTEPNHNNQRLFDGYRIRKLTPKECWRLMGFNDDEFKCAAKVNSNTQLYKQARKLNCSKCVRRNI